MSNDIFAAFEARGVNQFGTLLLAPPVALDFVRECRKRGGRTELLGFDAFRLLPDNKIQPILEDSLDLTSGSNKQLSRAEKLASAEQFINDRISKDILFEMVVN